MILSWLLPNGNVKYYDTVTDSVQETDVHGVNVVPVAPATDLDREEYRYYYPASSPEEITARTAIESQISSAIQYIKDKKQNFTYSKDDLGAVSQVVSTAVESYKTFEYNNTYIDKLIIELLTELNSYNSLVFVSFDSLISLAGFTAIKYQGIIDSLEYRVTQLENG
jgi:hypothetical protein